MKAKLNKRKGNSMIKLYNENSLNIFYKIVNQHHDKNIIIVTDPPFNINYKYNTYKDNMNENEYYKMLGFYFHDLPSVVIHYPENLYKLAFQIGKFPTKVISWVYNSNTDEVYICNYNTPKQMTIFDFINEN